MISVKRIQIDLLGQIILIVAAFLLYFFHVDWQWNLITIIILGIWQLASALHLYLAYKYVNKINFLKVSFIILASTPVWFEVVGYYAWLPIFGLTLSYLIQTYCDWKIIKNRPVKFWQLKF